MPSFEIYKESCYCTSSATEANSAIIYSPTTPPTHGMEVYMVFQNNNTNTLYDDGQIRIRLILGTGGTDKILLTNVNQTFQNIWLVGSGFFQNFGLATTAQNNEVTLHETATTTDKYSMTGYITADNPSYGLYRFTFYFNDPSNGNNYSSLVIKYYKDPSV
jgi:hypothetical protein